MPAGPGEVDEQRLPALLERQVDVPDRDLQRRGVRGRAEAAPRAFGQPAEQRVQRRRVGQRRQPHLVRDAAAGGDLLDHHAQHGGLGRVVLDGLAGPAAAAATEGGIGSNPAGNGRTSVGPASSPPGSSPPAV